MCERPWGAAVTGKVDIWMPIDIGDYIADTLDFTTEEHGAYLLLIFAYWKNRGPLPDDDRRLRTIAKLSLHKWKKTRPVLVQKFRVENGLWHHKRIDAELHKAAENQGRRRAQTQAARQAKAAQTSSVTETPLPSPSPSTESPSLRSGVSKRGPPVAKANGVAPWEIQQAVDLWNGLAGDVGLPRCEKLTKARRTKLRNRIRDAGGLDGWQEALEKIRGDPFFRGDNKRGWRCGIDFLLRESSFTKLMEGYYDFGRQEYVFDAGELARRAGISGNDSDLFSAASDVRSGIKSKGNGSEEQ